jgi:hypothetical protein
MDPQLIVVIVLAALAAAYLLRRAIRTWTKSAGGCGGCGGGCGPKVSRVKEPVTLIESLTVRRRPAP